MSDRPKVTKSSGSVFADLGMEDAAEMEVKFQLAFVVKRIIKERGLKQREAAEVLGCTQPEVSSLLRYHLDDFSLERLMTFLLHMGRDVEISLRETHGQSGALSVRELEPA
jgi:predicted XRE-type DNA-binding protein